MATITNYFEQAQLSMAAYAPGLQRGAFEKLVSKPHCFGIG